MSPTAAPTLIDSNDPNPVELGVKFRAESNGYVTGLRFYKASTNVGTHVGHIWSNSGVLLGSATFTNETGSGWQQVNFSTPIAVSANTTYIASYFAPSGHYSANTNAFATTGIDNPPVHALANGVDGSNGVYLYSSTSGFPTNSYKSTNYWVDVVYSASQSAPSYTIMNATTTPTMIDSNDPNPVELGVKFRAESNGYVTGLRFYKASTNVGTHVGNIWSKSGVLLGSATFTNETGSGWQQVNFSTPIAVSANTTYIASYFAPSGHYSADEKGFATGIDNPPLHALADGVDGSSGVYLYSSTSGFPTDSYDSDNYWVDIVYSAAPSAGADSKLTLNANTLNFGGVTVNTAATQSVTLTSTGSSAVTVNSASITGTGFTIVAGTLPVTLNPGQSVALQVQFKPTATGTASGQLTISSNSTTSSTASVALTGNSVATTNPQLTLSVTTLNFGGVTVNTAATQSVTLTSTGSSAVTVNSASITGASFKIVAGTFPVTLSPSQSLTLQVSFSPTATGTASGSLTISSNSTTRRTASVALTGTGATSTNPQLTLSATTLSFGSVTVNTSKTQSVTLTSTGSSAVTVNSASITGTGFAIVGGTFPVTLNPSQSLTLQVSFSPTATGTASGQLTIRSDSTTGSSTAVAVSGTGVSVAHEADLSWSAPNSSPDPVAGYNIYRSAGSGSFALLNSSIDTQTAYVDSAVASGATYTYIVKSVGSNGVESVASNQIAVTIP